MDSFRWARYEFILLPEGEIILPSYKGSALQGGFGHAFRKAVCIAKDKTYPRIATNLLFNCFNIG